MIEFSPGQRVSYEMAKKDGSSFAIDAIVVEKRRTRYLIEYLHWTDGRRVQSLVRPHRLTAVDDDTAHAAAHGGPDAP